MRKDTDEDDRLRKTRPMLDILQNSFRSCLYPFQKLVIDELLILLKGRWIL